MTQTSAPLVEEEHQSLWLLTISPGIWSIHFLVSYTVAAIWCGRASNPAEGIGLLHLLITVLAVVALSGIAITGWIGWRKQRHGAGAPPHDQDTPEDRHRFIGFATLLLSWLSAIATVYVTISILLVRNCW